MAHSQQFVLAMTLFSAVLVLFGFFLAGGEFSHNRKGSPLIAPQLRSTWLLGNNHPTAREHMGLCPCGHFDETLFADIHDGDHKLLTLDDDNQLMIRSANPEESWEIVASVDSWNCTALIEFRVPGKPSPPPVPLLATFWNMHSTSAHRKTTIEFTDPSGTLASPTDPLNHWVALSREERK